MPREQSPLHPRRVQFRDDRLEHYQDSVRELFDRQARSSQNIFGRPRPVVVANHSAQFGELVSVDPTGGAVVVFLPRTTADDLGRSLAIYNNTSSINVITVQAATGETVGGANSISLTTGNAGLLLSVAARGEWVSWAAGSTIGAGTALGSPTSTQTTNYNAAYGDLVVVDPTSGALSVNLPAATAGDKGKIITVYNHSASTNTITIDPSGSENIAGSTTITITTARQAMICVVVDAGEWMAHRGG